MSASFPVTQALGPWNWHAACTLQLFRMDFVDVDILILRTCSLTVRACSAAHYWAGAAAPTAVSWRAHWVRRGEPPEAGRATLPPRAWGPTSSQEQPLADGGDPQARGRGGEPLPLQGSSLPLPPPHFLSPEALSPQTTGTGARLRPALQEAHPHRWLLQEGPPRLWWARD